MDAADLQLQILAREQSGGMPMGLVMCFLSCLWEIAECRKLSSARARFRDVPLPDTQKRVPRWASAAGGGADEHWVTPGKSLSNGGVFPLLSPIPCYRGPFQQAFSDLGEDLWKTSAYSRRRYPPPHPTKSHREVQCGIESNKRARAQTQAFSV